MSVINVLHNLYKALYGWLIGTDSQLYRQFLDAGVWDTSLAMMVATSVVIAAIYYFVVASKVNSATIANYMWTYIIGAIIVVVCTPLICQWVINGAFADGKIPEQIEVLKYIPTFLLIGVANFVYYTLLYWLWSSIFRVMPGTKANNITLWSVIFGK